MNSERIVVLGVALGFYAIGGWSLYGQYQRDEARETGRWASTDAMISEAYMRDIKRHDLEPHSLLGYRYIVQRDSAEHADAVLAGDPSANHGYSTGLGLIGFGTLIALVRELVLRRRGRYRGEAMPVAWQELRAVLNKKIY